LNATWLCAKHVLLVVKTIGRGPIVSVASLRANLTIVGMLRYAAAKPGVVGMTCSLAFEVGSYGLRANAVSSGYIRTALVDEFFAQHPDLRAEAGAHGVQPFGRLASRRGRPKSCASWLLRKRRRSAARIGRSTSPPVFVLLTVTCMR